MKINFLGLGVQKAGTSTLHDILKQHSQVLLPESKEAHFFDLSDKYEKGIEWLYKTHFTDYISQRIVGKFTPEYLYIDDIPQKINITLGKELKFIVILRNPVERALSHYNMIFRRGLEKLNFFEAIEKENDRIKESELSNIEYSYMNRGYYSQQIKRYLEIFPRQNFLFLVFETDIVENLPQTIDRVQAFLGLDNEVLNCNIKSNEGFVPRFISVNQFIRNNKLIRLIGKKLLPDKLKERIILKIYNINKSAKNTKMFKLDTGEKDKLFEKYFLEDSLQLTSLTGINYKAIWTHE